MAADRRLTLAIAANGVAVAVTVVLMVALAPLFPPPAVADLAGRLGLAARLSVWPALVLLLVILAVIATRGLCRLFNPIDDPETRVYRVCQRALSNTVEQTLLFLPGLTALCALLPLQSLGFPALFTLLFVVGRVLFWTGYILHPFARAPGMAMTLTVNMVVVGWAVLLAL
ncbi:MAPEG family protein [Azospirillum sp. RWY-5-1]|uniref:MAPEG family protein n=1 Tax=Azospirillum oleiclasticum TaxID=2735135 RepID=A0ABX2TKF0_9PROT|nr:MAPEG family protein [Azospirillum oleiclasticum]NYZ16324.1 MAPEG family protein [Azospirillum oleiclasticum]NYZ23811.1 MAPEG family protein [Azospirillum oleiclasticum]